MGEGGTQDWINRVVLDDGAPRKLGRGLLVSADLKKKNVSSQ